MNKFEIEIKSLLGTEQKKDQIMDNIRDLDPNCNIVMEERQLNHYFSGGDLNKLYMAVSDYLNEDQANKLKDIIKNAKNHSVRTRWSDKTFGSLLVIKASLNQDTSTHSVSRVEFEEKFDLTIQELDQILLDCGFEYLSKWSRHRQKYRTGNMNIFLDKNAGYGYVAEFEIVVDNQSDIENAEKSLREYMDKVGADELSQARIERMFEHYNQNWRDYYGTDKIFNIE